MKKDFRLKKVINSCNVFSFKCSYPDCIWWLRVVKFTSSDRLAIRIFEKCHTCGSEHLTSHNPHVTAKVIGKYFEIPSTRDMSNQLHTKLSCKVSYWKIYKGMKHAKSNFRGTHEHGYAVLNAYRICLKLRIQEAR